MRVRYQAAPHPENNKGQKYKSGWQDSNLRPPAPKAGAMTGYATPRICGANIAHNRWIAILYRISKAPFFRF